MDSVAYYITLLLILVAVARGEDVAAVKNNNVDSKWIVETGGWSVWSGLYTSFLGLPWLSGCWTGLFGICYGGTFFPSSMVLYFAKATEEAHSVTRRAIRLDAEHLFRRDNSNNTVTCVSEKGAPQTFSKSDCTAAATKLGENNLHTASSGNCKLTLLNFEGKVVPKNLPDETLQKAVNRILDNCDEKSEKPSKVNQVDTKQVAMILSAA